MADEVAALSYEAALRELDEIIARLERGDVDLEAAIAAYDRGAALAGHCAELLDRTEQTITQLVVGPNGEVERPFTPPAQRAELPPPTASPARGRSAEQRLFGDEAGEAAGSQGAAVDPDVIPF